MMGEETAMASSQPPAVVGDKDEPIVSDFLVIGAGLSGLAFALEAAKYGTVNVVCKAEVMRSATGRAQGGIAAVLKSPDSFESHIQDTLVAGAGLCHRPVVEHFVRGGPSAIEFLNDCGVTFCSDRGKEAAHSFRRVLHDHDHTGRTIQECIARRVSGEGRIKLFEHHTAVNLAARMNRVQGAHVLDPHCNVRRFVSKATVLATGGAGLVFKYTSNPDGATGDGVAMAYRAGATVSNLEFFQFHPTLLFARSNKRFLISERLRGEGGILRDAKGTAFMTGYHADREMAPRDIVARSMDLELKKGGQRHLYLDMTHKDEEFLRSAFPDIYGTCMKAGINIANDMIPVVPGAHYMIGGVKVDLRGRTDVASLYCVGETACTGLHGANRLASNSLLEACVLGRDSAHAAAEEVMGLDYMEDGVPIWDSGDAGEPDEWLAVAHNWNEVRTLMTNYASAVRTDKRLRRARQRLESLQLEVERFYWGYNVKPQLVELRNVVRVASLMVASAMMRKESRGAHYNYDHPDLMDQEVDTVMRKGFVPIPE